MKKISPLVRMYILVFSICALVLASAVWFDNNVDRSGFTYLPNAGPGGTLFLSGDSKYSDQDLRDKLELLLKERQKEQR